MRENKGTEKGGEAISLGRCLKSPTDQLLVLILHLFGKCSVLQKSRKNIINSLYLPRFRPIIWFHSFLILCRICFKLSLYVCIANIITCTFFFLVLCFAEPLEEVAEIMTFLLKYFKNILL